MRLIFGERSSMKTERSVRCILPITMTLTFIGSRKVSLFWIVRKHKPAWPYKPVKRISDKYYMEGSIKGNYSFYINELNTLDLMRDKMGSFF